MHLHLFPRNLVHLDLDDLMEALGELCCGCFSEMLSLPCIPTCSDLSSCGGYQVAKVKAGEEWDKLTSLTFKYLEEAAREFVKRLGRLDELNNTDDHRLSERALKYLADLLHVSEQHPFLGEPRRRALIQTAVQEELEAAKKRGAPARGAYLMAGMTKQPTPTAERLFAAARRPKKDKKRLSTVLGVPQGQEAKKKFWTRFAAEVSRLGNVCFNKLSAIQRGELGLTFGMHGKAVGRAWSVVKTRGFKSWA